MEIEPGQKDLGKEPSRDIAKSWNSYLRHKQPNISCPECGADLTNDLGMFRKHAQSAHTAILDALPSDDARKQWIRERFKTGQQLATERVQAKTSGGATDAVAGAGAGPFPGSPSNRRRAADADAGSTTAVKSSLHDQESSSTPKSPSSLKREGSRSQSPPKRSKADPSTTLPSDDSRAEFDRGALRARAGKRLWHPDDDVPASTRHVSAGTSNQRPPRPGLSTGHPPSQKQTRGLSNPSARPFMMSSPRPSDDGSDVAIIKQPETRPISQEQLVAEVKGIYAGLVMVENKCIEVDQGRNSQGEPNNIKLNDEQWQALIALHRTLLHEHHDFFLASQHPSASTALRRLASKYAMPARMWRHGIHSFLELLRHRLPASLEHMLTFIYLAYSMMALLYETVPAFEDTWIECLGDLGRYRMAIEDDNPRDREVWTTVSRGWYSKASDKAPTTGRLYHHLAILARPNALQQLFYYSKSLCVAIPFTSARESILTLFDPMLAPSAVRQVSPEHAFVRAHGIMFSKKQYVQLGATMDEFISSLDNYIGRSTRRFLEPGYYMGISSCCAIAGWGNDANPVYRAIKPPEPEKENESQDQPMERSDADESAAAQDLADALLLANRTHDVILRRFGDSNILSYVHTVLVFMDHITLYPEAMAHVAPTFPWKLMSLMLNTLLTSCQPPSLKRAESDRFPYPEKMEDRPRPLPEDYAMRGLLWADQYYPDDWFTNSKVEEDERYLELGSLAEERRVRVLYLGCRIARSNEWLRYDGKARQFSVSPQFDVEVKDLPALQGDSMDFEQLPDAVPSGP